jgi:hypothetical protein
LPVGFDVMLGGFGRVVGGVSVVSLGYMRMMGSHFVVAVLMMLGSFPVVVGGMLMMLGSLTMMVRCFLRHGVFLSLKLCRKANLGLPSIVGRNDCEAVANR